MEHTTSSTTTLFNEVKNPLLQNYKFDIAIEGCAHGELDKIYESIKLINSQHGKNIQLLICCGDFQSVRNNQGIDLNSMAVPLKYRKLNSFYHYYNGTKRAPCLTLFIGGNHEASEFLWELPYGGWVAPLIYYVGWANVVNFVYEVMPDSTLTSLNNVEGNIDTKVSSSIYQKICITGLSGIYKWNHYQMGHYEYPPFSEDTKRSIYHVRQQEVLRLGMLNPTLKDGSASIDICLSHDWPLKIWEHGEVKQLLAIKPFFTEDIQRGRLGSPAAKELLEKLKPNFWFSAHLHVKFPALVVHPQSLSPQSEEHSSSSDTDSDSKSSPQSSDVIKTYHTSIVKDKNQDNPDTSPVKAVRKTKFLALDKCLPGRSFLQIVPSSAFPPKSTGKPSNHISYFDTDPQALTKTDFYTTGPCDDNHKFRCYFAYDDEWLSILKKTDHLLGLTRCPNFLPATFAEHEPVIGNVSRELALHPDLVSVDSGATDLLIPILPLGDGDYKGGDASSKDIDQRLNPQTLHFCDSLGITDPCEAHLLNSQHYKRSRKMNLPSVDVEVVTGATISASSACTGSLIEIARQVGSDDEQPLNDIPPPCNAPPKKMVKRRNLEVYQSVDE